MKANYLFPAGFKVPALFILIPSVIIGILLLTFNYEPELLNIRILSVIHNEFGDPISTFRIIENNVLNEIIMTLILVSAILVAFSKEKAEDEFIQKIRLESLVWSTYVNYAVLLLSIIFVYDITFLWVMVFNMFTLLIFFIIRFNFQVWKLNKTIADEE